MPPKWKVIYFTSKSGDNPVSGFLDSLPGKQQAKILKIFEYIRNHGFQAIAPPIRKLSGTPMWEIRVLGRDNIRVIYIVPRKQTVFALHGFVKKTPKTPRRKIQTALERYREWYLTN